MSKKMPRNSLLNKEDKSKILAITSQINHE